MLRYLHGSTFYLFFVLTKMEASNFESIFECISDGVNKVLVLVLVLHLFGIYTIQTRRFFTGKAINYSFHFFNIDINFIIEYIIMSFIATTVRNTVEYSTVMVLPHSSDITVSMDAIDACGQFNVTVHSTPNFFPEIALISLAHLFGNPIRYNSFFVPLTFSESVFKATSTQFHQGKSVPIPRLTHLTPKPIRIHSSSMMLFDIIPAGNTGLFNVTIILALRLELEIAYQTTGD